MVRPVRLAGGRDSRPAPAPLPEPRDADEQHPERQPAGRRPDELSLVSFTLLGHLEHQGGCRATDLAAHYTLDKSTISRQVGALEKAGLVERRLDPADHRVHVLHLTERGHEVLAQVGAARRVAFQERPADWSGPDLSKFAEYLLRYNEAAEREAGVG
ncbi:MarR family winged helix-turn-helix transcriptional regulator [Streptomyces sp. NPDC018059]|uniref:MarR family winged helix-turn-helix transcriptional regulator n=1 Tax=Streptomyces sp. NPDC018059 TaxID=3365041 RepID=UPI0037A2B395